MDVNATLNPESLRAGESLSGSTRALQLPNYGKPLQEKVPDWGEGRTTPMISGVTTGQELS